MQHTATSGQAFDKVGISVSTSSDAGCGIDVVAELLGHASIASSEVYVHPDPSRLRAAVDRVPSPREQRAGK